jgi:glycosyltransferase involved in cell wall biosynthesis
MNVGILIESETLAQVDCSAVEKGNPGIGGTQYLLLQLAYYLSTRANGIAVKLFLLERLNVSFECEQILIENDMDAVEKLDNSGIDKLIFIPNSKMSDFYNRLDEWQGYAIAWVHNYITYIDLRNLSNSSATKKIVFVGKQHYDAYCDDEIAPKSLYIYNMVTPIECVQLIEAEKKLPIVTYVGALIKTKGFHKLAREWKKIVKRVPEAQLYVIGSGKLYNKNSKLGKFNVAEQKYEDKFMKYLTDNKGDIIDSVHFLGSLGTEKAKFIQATKVGVANPTGKSETFCLSAVEFEGINIPVVSYKGYGLLDTVVDGKTGFLCKSGYGLRESIIKLLTDNKLNREFGINGKNYYEENFTSAIIVTQWEKLILDAKVDFDDKIHFDSKVLDDFKLLKLLNRTAKSLFNGHWMSIAGMISLQKCIIKKMLKK